jgi:nucleoside-diphosphate-sugar epimerase
MSNKVKKVLVVGGAGYIGGGVTNVLLEKKIPFTVYDRLLYESQYLKPVDFIFGDIRDSEKLAKILPDFSHVIWLAAIVGDAACQIKPELTIAVNQDSVRWLADNYDGRIIFLSTCSVYGEHDKMADENSLVKPLSLYAQSKLGAEKYLKDKNALTMRLGTVFGISDVYSRLRMDLVLNYMTARALTQGKIQVFGGGQWRPLIHIKDIAKFIVDNLENETKGIYNVATINIQIKDLGRAVSRLTGCEVEWVEQKFEDQRNYRVSTEKAIKDKVMSLEGIRDIEYGVREIVKLIKSGRVKYTDSDIYFNEKHIANLLEKGELQ